jgi:hypothetical protein
MDNVQNCDSYIDMPSPEAYNIYSENLISLRGRTERMTICDFQGIKMKIMYRG